MTDNSRRRRVRGQLGDRLARRERRHRPRRRRPGRHRRLERVAAPATTFRDAPPFLAKQFSASEDQLRPAGLPPRPRRDRSATRSSSTSRWTPTTPPTRAACSASSPKIFDIRGRVVARSPTRTAARWTRPIPRSTSGTAVTGGRVVEPASTCSWLTVSGSASAPPAPSWWSDDTPRRLCLALLLLPRPRRPTSRTCARRQTRRSIPRRSPW